MSAPAISFCIPTYNFGDFIGATLDSIIAQAGPDVQIVIVDGGSTDHTPAVIAERSRRWPGIKLIRREQRCGVDRDILEAVDQADGEVCWLFSSDDLLAPGALDVLRRELKEPWDVFLTTFAVCDKRMKRLRQHPVIQCRQPQTFDWSLPGERERYFALAQTTTAFFSFISSIVVRRERWAGGGRAEQFIGSYWIIAAKLFDLAHAGLRVRYYPGELLQKRGNNDSFLAAGALWRLELSLIQFARLGDLFFGAASPEAGHIRRVLRNEYGLLEMAVAKVGIARTRDRDQMHRFNELARRHFAGTGDALRRHLLTTAPTWVVAGMLNAYCGAQGAAGLVGIAW